MNSLKETSVLEVTTNFIDEGVVTTAKETKAGPKLTYHLGGLVTYADKDKETKEYDCEFEEEIEFCTGIPLESRMQCMDYIHRRLEEFKTRSLLSKDYSYVGDERELYLSPVSEDWAPLPEEVYDLFYEVKLVVDTQTSKCEYKLFRYTFNGEIETETFHENLIIESSYYRR